MPPAGTFKPSSGSAGKASAVHAEMPAIASNRAPIPLALTSGPSGPSGPSAPSAHTAAELKPSDSVNRRPATRERMRPPTEPTTSSTRVSWLRLSCTATGRLRRDGGSEQGNGAGGGQPG